MIDRSLMVTLLAVLRERRDLQGGIEEYALFSEVNLRACQAVTTVTLREHLTLAEEKNWAAWKLDQLRAKRWRITDAGVSALDDLRGY